MPTYNLTPYKTAYVDGYSPDTVFPTNPSTAYDVTPYSTARARYLLLGLNGWPASLKRKKLVSMQLRVYVKKGYLNLFAYNMASNWDPATVTFNNKPSNSGSSIRLGGTPAADPDPPWDEFWMTQFDSTETEMSAQTNVVLNKGSLAVGAMTPSTSSKWYIKTVLAGGGSPYLQVTYEDTNITSKVQEVSYPTGTKSILNDISFTWKYVKNSSYSCQDETWTQSSAKLYWKTSAESTWHTINASGSTMSLTVPAGTFPEGATIQWYIQGTDTDGTTTSTTPRSFTTSHSTITPNSYPSGNSVDNRYAQTFSWTFGSGYSQRSATLYWKTSNEQNWHDVAASGTTSSVTIPAYTFPSGNTIQWYVSGTDNYGYTSSSSQFSFNVPASSCVPSSYPSGSGVNSGVAISFLWDITSSLGNYTQRSAVFHWKESTSGEYTNITISDSTKRVTVPANTIPTGKTIQWHVTATDSSGAVSDSSAKSFNTASPVLNPDVYPSGRGINFGVDITFSWKLQAASGDGDYAQASAILYWRTNTADPWTQVSVSGNTKSVTIPAYTFPSGKTVSWYISAVDFSGTTAECREASFVTATPQITPQDSPTSGYADPRDAITFRWYFTDGTNAYDQQSATLKWREEGEENWNSVSASGTTQQLTVAANTFPIMKNIEWMLVGTDRGGSMTETTVYTFSTTASTAYAICQRPVGRVEDGTKPIYFSWVVRNADGTEPTRIVVKWKLPSETASSWRTILDENEAVYTVTVAADTFPSGAIDWEVIAYNKDGTAGPASLASFVCVVAPDPPSGLSATPVPRTTIRWQANGQEAYEIQIDGKTVKSEYGPTVTSYRQEEPLSDGIHQIRIRIQGPYGLWSNWADTSVSVVNSPKGSATLTGKFRVDADLKWTYTGVTTPEVVAIYRDGKWIGRVTGRIEFTDRFVLGDHTYRVEYWFSDGYYTRSNDLTGSMASDVLRIAEFSGGDWMPLKLSEKSERKQVFSWGQTNALHSVTGSRWPVLETAPYENLAASYDCSFTEAGCVKKFEQFRGRMVIMKSKGGNVVIGGLMVVEKTVGDFYTAFSFMVQQCHWEDFVNDDAND